MFMIIESGLNWFEPANGTAQFLPTDVALGDVSLHTALRKSDTNDTFINPVLPNRFSWR